MTRMILLFFFANTLLSFNGYSKNDSVPCLNLKLGTNINRVSIDSLQKFKIQLTLQNCSKENLQLDTMDIPNYEDDESKSINFKFYYYDSKKGFQPYVVTPADLQNNMDMLSNTSITVKANGIYTYSFRLFSFYEIKNKGRYRIYAYYKRPFKKKGSYYLQHADNYIEVLVQ